MTKDGKLNGVKLEIFQETGATATDGPLVIMEFMGFLDNGMFLCHSIFNIMLRLMVIEKDKL